MHRHMTLALALLAAAAAASSAQTLGSPGPLVSPRSDGVKQCVRVVVLTQEHVSPQSLCSPVGAVLVASHPEGGMHLLESSKPMPPALAEAYAQQVAALPGVLVAELLQPASLPELDGCGAPAEVSGQQCTVAFADATPSDGEFEGQPALDLVGFDWAQWLSAHEPVLVAVIDTGIDASHPALAGRVAAHGWDFLAGHPGAMDVGNGRDDDGDGWIDEAHGHGTHVASVITLVNPDARILPLRVLDADGNGDSYDVAQAILYAVDHGAHVINLSLSMKGESNAVAVALEYAALMGVSVFASAGNTGKEKVLFPASYEARQFELDVPLLPVSWTPSADAVTAVAATDAHGEKAGFSAFGFTVDLDAPGIDVYGAMPGGGYAWWSGTSMATAVASGVASLVLSTGGTGMAVPAHAILKETAKPIDALNPTYAGKLGKGFVDAWDAAKIAKFFGDT